MVTKDIPEMVFIPGGSFMMGSSTDERKSSSSERPRHKVTIPDFYMGRYPVTQAQYKFIMGKIPSPFSRQGDNKPVDLVSWNEAVAFCQKLSAVTSKTYRLPSEAEWEYACRAGTTTPFYFGKTITTDLANYCGCSTYGQVPNSLYRKETTTVGSFPPNAFGLYDMHGNVWEWCQDVWHDSYQGAPSDGRAWTEGNTFTQERRVLRGGSWSDIPWYCRSACRSSNYADNRYILNGFRVACDDPSTLLLPFTPFISFGF
jgi:formylglycine-generating enzyme required for sulfatase activity